MRTSLAVAAVLLLALPALAPAAETAGVAAPRSDADCAALLERWATDPKAAPKSVINACKDQLAAAAPPAPVPVEALADTDPCSGPDAASSVLCWGPWATPAPAAEGPLATLTIPDPPFECDQGADLSDVCVPELIPVLPVEGCQPGTPCGFATIVGGITSNGDPEDTEFGRIDLATDGTRFTIDPETGEPIESVPMTTNIQPRPDGYGNLRATGRDGEVNSRLIARIVQDEDGAIQLAADVWTHGTRENARSGYFAWGTATSQAGLDALNAGNTTLNFTGPMSVNGATTASLTVNMGASPDWNGTWTNPAWSFGAGGNVSGVNFISSPDQFTSNVVGSSDFVQGALVGEPGGNVGITHIIDVTLEGQGRIKDVGLLREVTTPPAILP